MKKLKSIWRWLFAPKLEVKIKHIITNVDGTQKEVSEEEAFKITGCRITIKN
jgi:hypothetical protein